ncbi:hypothetical protein AAFC00_006624 [Neodothiora populina]|uniref:HCP-like protein n=1 Tax=Neodothiora populina TaxID=2781224 RepID=A0ABR3PAQ9_9PEZI
MSHYPTASATFVPGGYDDYYMPPHEPVLVAPAPQRHMPEMSDQIQEGIANMNLTDRTSTMSTMSTSMSSSPRFGSAFPAIHDRARIYPNVAPSDEEVEKTLEEARMPVLTSNDPDMQLAWAQDALLYAGTAMENEERLQATQPARPATPPVERQIRTDAMNVVHFLADQSHPQAVFMKGMWFEFGRFNIAQDKKEAFRCYARAADKGYARAEYRLGMLYEASNDAVKALRHYHKGVEQADSASLYRLGMMTLRGQHGQDQDFVRGIDLIRRSADSADENAPQGAYVYGMLLARQLPQIRLPEGVLSYDEASARHYIEKAAFLKFAKAQLKMGSAYELGSLGCQFDPALSLHYNRLASRQGEAEADMAISKWFLVGHEGLFAKNEEISYTFANRAAQTGLSNAEFAMGYFNELGIYVAKDVDLALHWYRRAASNGNPDAAGRIDGISRKQVLSRKDHETVALTRIRSQYGSQRGAKPERFQQGHPPRMSSITELPRHDLPPAAPLKRTPSVAPYPLDDRPPTVPPPDIRSQSVAPYPVDDGPPHIHRAATALPDRPSSAFSFDPEIRPSSTATTGSGRQRMPSGMAGQSGPMLDPRRPVPGHGSRIPSGVQPRPVNTTPLAPAPPPHSSAPGGALDIGFVAPPDVRRAARLSRASSPPKKPVPANGSAPRPLRQTASTSDFNHPPRTSSRPNLASPGQSQGPAGAATPSEAPKPASSPTRPPPKKGPKTFEEMGVPATKQDSECTIM